IRRMGTNKNVSFMKKISKNLEIITCTSIIIKTSGKINLEEPDIVFNVFICKESVVITKLVHISSRKEIYDRYPSKRYFFHSSAMRPLLIRAMINIGRAGERNGAIVLDPFCGTGGFQIELADIRDKLGLDFKIIGFDLNKWMARGTKKNLLPATIDLIGRADAAKIPLKAETVDLIVTDPPYGVNSATMGKTAETVVNDCLKELVVRLKKNGRFVISIPDTVKLSYKEAGLELMGRYEQKVHRSLTRILYVFKK
ncbi:MAG: methyltransferase domain-containing protein, partial [Candidatus Hodarchaeales archaeon]